MDEDPNKATLDAYEKGLEQYNSDAVMTVSGDVKIWIDKALTMLKPGTHILEIGSAHGRDALYIESQGFAIERTDAAQSFVNHLQAQGHKAHFLNVLTDDLGGPYNMIFANAVLVHFTVQQTKDVLKKIKAVLRPGGFFVFSVKIGEGSAWTKVKLNDARFYTYWQEQPLKELLESAGFVIKYFEIGQTGKNNKGWYHVITDKT